MRGIAEGRRKDRWIFIGGRRGRGVVGVDSPGGGLELGRGAFLAGLFRGHRRRTVDRGRWLR